MYVIDSLNIFSYFSLENDKYVCYLYITHIYCMHDVCIIGSGQSGLVTCKTFAEKNYNVIVLEKNDINGLFNTINEKDYFKWSTSRSMSGFSDFPMDKTLPHWFTIQNYVDYLESYKKHFNLDQFIRYNSTVTNCKQNEREEWIVTYLNNGIETKLTCKKLIICAGLNQTLKFPDIVNGFAGEIIHTDEVYKNMTKHDWKSKFSGKRVLLLGGGESAFDIGHIVVQHANDFYFASQNYTEWFIQGSEEEYNLERVKKLNDKCLNKISMNVKTPSDTFLSYAEYSLPEPISEFWHTWGRWIGNVYANSNCGKCNHQNSELCDKTETPEDLFKKYVVKRTDFMLDIYDNKVKLLFYPDKIKNKTVYTKDGIIENIDIIVCATGYKKHFPFLDARIMHDDFIKKMIPKNTSNIAFIGYARPTMGSIASIAEMQSWWIESYFANKLSYSIRTPVFRFKDVLNLENEHINSLMIGCYYLKDLAKDMRLEPNMVYLFFTDFELFKKIYTGSCHPMIYRIHGDKYYPESRNILMNTFIDFDNDRSSEEKKYFALFILFHLIFVLFLFVLSFLFTYILFLIQKYRNMKNIKYSNYLVFSYLITTGLILYFYVL